MKIPNERKTEEVKRNWKFSIEQNVKKSLKISNPIDCEEYRKKTVEISQSKLLSSQINDYVNKNQTIAILSAFPVFLYEYFGKRVLP